MILALQFTYRPKWAKTGQNRPKRANTDKTGKRRQTQVKQAKKENKGKDGKNR